MKNYNLFALNGDTDTSDFDVCETLGIDPELAGKSELNDVIINQMHRENFEGYIQKGYNPDEAMRLADLKAEDARQRVRLAMKNM